MTNDPGVGRSHWMTRPAVPVLDHEALLTLARKVRAAAADTEPERIETALRRFSLALDRHLRAESGSLSRMVPADARLLRKGQDRICGLAAGLLDDASRGCQVPGRDCHARVEELIALLSLQVRDEHRHALDRPAA